MRLPRKNRQTLLYWLRASRVGSFQKILIDNYVGKKKLDRQNLTLKNIRNEYEEIYIANFLPCGGLCACECRIHLQRFRRVGRRVFVVSDNCGKHRQLQLCPPYIPKIIPENTLQRETLEITACIPKQRLLQPHLTLSDLSVMKSA